MKNEDLFLLASKGVSGLKPYQPGKPIEELEREYGISNVVKLASNENPLGMSDLAKEAINKAVKLAHLYPDGNAFHLKKSIAEFLAVNENQITIGNGSNDVLEIIARSFADQNAEIIYSKYAFAVYPIVTQAIGAKHVVTAANDWGHDLHAMADAISDKTKVIFIANPNNPTGTYLTADELQSFLANVPENVIVVIDEAYHEYIDASDYASALNFLNDHPNLIVTRTFSKAYGLAGLRIGFCVSHPAIANILNRVRQPFNANSLALVAAQAALADQDFIKQAIAVNKAGMQQLVDAFNRLGLEYIPSVGNFIAVDVQADGQAVYEALLKKAIIVRPVGAYDMPQHIRVSIGSETDNQKFIQALEQVLVEAAL